MKRKNIILVMLIVFSFGMFLIQSCTKEDPTTFTTQQAFTTPVVTSPEADADGIVFIEGASAVDLKWESENSGGDPVKWDVYFGTSDDPEKILTGTSQLSVTVQVENGETYYWYVKTQDSRKIVTESHVNSFTFIDGSDPTIDIFLDVATDVKSAIGLDLEADDVVDLRFLIIKKSDMSIVEVVDDGAALEAYSGLGELADGEYLLGVDIFSSINAGDFNTEITLDLSLSFEQFGVFSSTLDFPGVMTNQFTCSYYRTYLATITKTGASYSVVKSVSDWVDPSAADPSAMVGTWSGDDSGYDSEITSTVVGGKLVFDGIGGGWMLNDWGEIVITHTPVIAEFNAADGTFTIANQAIMTTTYEGDPQAEYFIEGTITANYCGGPDLVISYDFIQPDGAGGIAKYFKIPNFEAAITLDASGKKMLSQITGKKVKPARQ